MMALIGVRSSCESVARNSSFARLAAPGVGVGAGVVDGERGPFRDGLRDQQVLAVVGRAAIPR